MIIIERIIIYVMAVVCITVVFLVRHKRGRVSERLVLRDHCIALLVLSAASILGVAL